MRPARDHPSGRLARDHVGGPSPSGRAGAVLDRDLPDLLVARPGRVRGAGVSVGDHGGPEIVRRGSAAVPPVARERIVLGEGSTTDRLGAVERVLAGVIPVIDGIGKAVASGHGGEERPTLGESEAWWCCSGCKKRLGIVNNATGELRIRHDGGRFLYRITSGAGGKTATACNSCGVENVLKDAG